MHIAEWWRGKSTASRRAILAAAAAVVLASVDAAGFEGEHVQRIVSAGAAFLTLVFGG